MNNGKPARFGEISDRWEDVGTWVGVEELVDQEITVHDAKEVQGQFGSYILVKFTLPNAETFLGFTTGGVVLKKKILDAKARGFLPLPGKIVKNKRYYDIV